MSWEAMTTEEQAVNRIITDNQVILGRMENVALEHAHGHYGSMSYKQGLRKGIRLGIALMLQTNEDQ